MSQHPLPHADDRAPAAPIPLFPDMVMAPPRQKIPLWAWAALGALLAARIAILIATPLQLYPDEAQYWGWAQAPGWGYYSKPPLVAWLIAASTALFGDAEWAVRLPAALCHAGAAVALTLLARDLYGRAAGLVAGAIWLTTLAVTVSSLILSTDAPLLLLWSVMLLSLFRLVRRRSWVWAAALGAAIGLGMLAKYAMVYSVISLILAAALDIRVRRLLLSRHGALAALVCAALIAPNLAWNAMNGMATLTHTAANADWTGSLAHPGELVEFWSSQLGVFGPVLFPMLIAGCALGFTGALGRDGAALAAFAAPPLIIVSVQAFLAHAYANWAAAAYPAGAVLCAALLTAPFADMGAWARRGVVAFALCFNLIIAAVASAAFLSPRLVDTVGAANMFKQMRGWDETSDAILGAAAGGGFDTVAFDDRFVFHAVDYYGRDRPGGETLAMWRRFDAPSGHAEACCALPAGAAGPILLVSQFPLYDEWFAADFGAVTPLGEVRVDLGGGVERRLRLFRAEGFAPVAPRDGARPPGG